MNLSSLHSLFVDELHDIYDAERQLVDAIPKLSSAASNPDLKRAFDEHLAETRGHIERLNRVFQLIGSQPNGMTCKAIRGLVQEGADVIESEGVSSVKDAALIGAAQRVEHYEMAAYGTACALAKELDLDEAASLLHQTLEEEKAADDTLNKLAIGGLLASGINKEAHQSSV